MRNNNRHNSSPNMFWDRRQELESLRRWHAESPRLAVLHGRRRMGKTALLRQWLQHVAGCYVQASEGTPASQRAALAEDVQAIVPRFGEVVYPTWRALLDALKRQWPASAPVLVLDEFPYWVQTSPELPSLLQAMVDAPDAGRLPLVLCGSSQRMMQGLAMNADAPLYGRTQLLLRLQPIPIQQIRAALSLPDAVAAVEFHAAFGGVPRYWELCHDGRHATVEHALTSLVFAPQGVLHEEAERVLRDEEASTLERAICELIGRGARRPSELAARLGVKDTSLAKPLHHLAQLGLIERQTPYDLAAGRPAAGGRKAFYKLADPFLAMWYACVRPYLSGLNVIATSARKHAFDAWIHHIAAIWEDLCRTHWHRLGHQNIEWEPAGRYWTGRDAMQGEWDVVSVSADRKHVFLGKCNWMLTLNDAKLTTLIRTLKHRALPPLPKDAEVHLGLFLPRIAKLPRTIEGVAVLNICEVMEG